MKLRNDLPTEYDEDYTLNAEEQTIIIEVSFLNDFILDQIRMPMVTDMLGGDLLVQCFQKCLSACILTYLKAGLITEEFYNEHKDILDENKGIKDNINLNIMGVSDLSYDFDYLVKQYMTVLGHGEMIPKKDDLYGNESYFFRKNVL